MFRVELTHHSTLNTSAMTLNEVRTSDTSIKLISEYNCITSRKIVVITSADIMADVIAMYLDKRTI